MTEAQTILQMIEAVDPEDAVKLYEIDARVWCWLKSWEFIGFQPQGVNLGFIARQKKYGLECRDIPNQIYTRSRDALKAIRPDGWDFIDVSGGFNHNEWICQINMGPFTTKKRTLPTEELAELHAIIQAIQFERHEDETTL